MSKRAVPSADLDQRNSPSLAEVQAAFQRAILGGDDAILPLIPGNGRTTSEVLLGVYRHAYTARLAEVVANDYPHTKTMMGDEAFRAMALAFIAANPSSTPNARWFARAVPDFLAAAEPYRAGLHLSELAALERALGNAFDAADASVVTLSDLQAIDPDDWERLTFAAHPAVAVLRHATNALPLWIALKNGTDAPEPQHLPAPCDVLVWRHETTPMVRTLEAEEAMMWREAMAGSNFGQLCELVAIFGDAETAPLRAAQYLAGWLNSGLLTSATLS